MRYRSGAIIIILLALFIRAHHISELGTQNDEGLHIAVAEWLADDFVLYRDLFENRTPGVELVLAAIFSLTEPSVLLARFLTLGVVAITLSGLILAGKLSQELTWTNNEGHMRHKNVAGLAAGLLFGLAPLAIFWSRFTMLEHWQTAAITLAIVAALLAVSRDKMLWWLSSGILSGLAILAKQSGLVAAVIILLYLLLLFFRLLVSRPKKALGSWLIGLATPIIIFIIWLALKGAFFDFFHMLSAADQLAPLSGLIDKALSFGNWIIRRPLFFLAVIGGVSVLRSRRPAAWLPLLWATAEMVVLFWPPRLDFGWGGFSHYTLPALAAMSLLGGVGFNQIGKWVSGTPPKKMLVFSIMVVLLAATWGWLDDLNVAIIGNDYPSPTYDEELRIGQAVSALTDEDEAILILGNAVFYNRAGRRPANRYFHLPQYLPESRLWPEAEADILAALEGGNVGLVLISSRYLYERLPPSLFEALKLNWVPVAIYIYPYQHDLILYLPRPTA